MNELKGKAAALCVAALVSLWAMADSSVTNIYLDAELIQSAAGSKPGYGRFYGYRTMEEGPGDDAFQDALDKAKSEHVPLVIIWATDDCSHCSGFSSNMNDSKTALLEWMSERNAIFTYFKGTGSINTSGQVVSGKPPASLEAVRFLINTCGLNPKAVEVLTPYYGIYYLSTNGTANSVSGSFADDTWKSGSYAAISFSRMKERLDAYFSMWMGGGEIREPEPDPVPGAIEFSCGTSSGARLEAMPSTKTVYVPLTRVSRPNETFTTTLKVIYSDGTTDVQDLTWAKDENEKEVPVSVRYGTVGDCAQLRLFNADQVLNATNLIAFVAEAANSAKFPYWVGEKTTATLGWGEWTFDLDVATNKVRLASAVGTNAYTLVCAGGALWCPDCINVESSIYDQPAFKAWAADNHIALVSLDQPINGFTAPTLLSHDVSVLTRSSGSYYISRKGITAAAAQAQADRIYALSHTRWPAGLLINPDNPRLTNPELILMRPDGTIAGRLLGSGLPAMNRLQRAGGTLSSNEPYGLQENLDRLDELLKLGNDRTTQGLTEELNDWAGTTPLKYEYKGRETATLSAADCYDVFAVSGLKAGEPFRVDVSAPDATNTSVRVELLMPTNGIKGAGMKCKVIPSVAANTWRLRQNEIDAGIFLRVSAYAATDAYGVGESRYAVYGKGSGFTATISSVAVPLEYGTVGFPAPVAEAVESDRRFSVDVVRTGGSAGAVSAIVELDEAKTTADPESFVWKKAVEHKLAWEDFEYGVQSLTVKLADDSVWTGDRDIAFTLRLVDTEGATFGTTNLVVTVHDDEIRQAGTLAFAASSPVAVAGNVIEVTASSNLTLSVAREDGDWGTVGAAVVVSRGDVVASSSRVDWRDGESDVKTLTFRLPAWAAFGSNPVFTISLQPDEGVSVSPTGRRVTVRAIEAARAKFSEDDLLLETIQLCGLIREVYLSDSRFDASSRMKVLSGDLPSGVSVSWDGDEGKLTVSGIARSEGSSEVVLRLETDTDAGTVVSEPIRLGFSVRSAAECSPLLEAAHDFRDMPVYATDASGICRVVGSLNVSLPLTGRLSAKYRRSDGTLAVFAFNGWTEGSGSVFVEGANHGCTLRVQPRTANDGGDEFAIQLSDPLHVDEALVVNAQCTWPWSADDSSADWAGTYTVECVLTNLVEATVPPLCEGSVALALRHAATAGASGRVTYAGALPNGRPASGSARLVRGTEGLVLKSAILPVFQATAADTFGATFAIASNGGSWAVTTRQIVWAEDGVTPSWAHREKSYAQLSPRCDYVAYGSWYVPESDWHEYLKNNYLGWYNTQTRQIPLYAERNDVIPPFTQWMALTPDGGNIVLVGTDPSTTFTFNAASGFFRGTCKPSADDPVRTFFGVVLPGWIAACDCGGPGITSGIVRPFGTGSWSYSESQETGEGPSVTVRVGGSVKLGE